MQEFVRRRNLVHYRRLLAGVLGTTDRAMIMKLLAEEETRELPPLRVREAW
jgi:hypothetical protein